MNLVIIDGNIGAVQVNPDNTRLRVATHFTMKDGSTGTDWHNVIAYGRKAELLSSAKVSDNLFVSGKLRTSVIEDEKGKHEFTSIIVGTFKLIPVDKKETKPTTNN